MKNTIKNAVSVTLNEKKAGIELNFSEKPNTEVRAALKSAGCKFAKAAKDGHNNHFWWIEDKPESRKALRNALKGVGIDITIPRKAQAKQDSKPEKASVKPAPKKASPASGNDTKIAALLKQQIALNEQLLALLNA